MGRDNFCFIFSHLSGKLELEVSRDFGPKIMSVSVNFGVGEA